MSQSESGAPAENGRRFAGEGDRSVGAIGRSARHQGRSLLGAMLCGLVVLLVSGCSKGGDEAAWKKYTAAGIDAARHGRQAEATQMFEEALKEGRRFAPESSRLAESLNNLALAYGAEKKYDEAEKLFQQALELDQKRSGEQSAEVGDDLNNLAALYTSAGKYDQAAETYQRAVKIREKVFGSADPKVAITLRNYAAMLIKAKRTAEAELITNLADTIDRQGVAAATMTAAAGTPAAAKTPMPNDTPAPSATPAPRGSADGAAAKL